MRKSQSAMNAAVLITIVSALIILYIILLPSDKRLELIGENRSSSETGTEGKILVEDKEIVMEHFNDDSKDYDKIPSVNLYTKKSSKEIFEDSSVYVKTSVFGKETKEIPFSVDDVDNTDNLLLSFFVKKHSGRLMVSVNEREVFNNYIESINVEPISIPNSILAKSNILKLEASGVGFAFWAKNEYLLEEIKITADITDVSARGSEVTFNVPKSEISNIDKATLRFVPECQEGKVGILEVSINGKGVFSGVPDCGIPRPLSFAPELLVSGPNKISFHSDEGRYLIDQIKVTTDFDEPPSYTYFFDVDNALLKDINSKKKVVNLTMFFVDDEEDKEAEIFINDRKTFMRRHNDFEFSRNIGEFLEVGSNSLKVVPERRMEVRKLVVRAE